MSKWFAHYPIRAFAVVCILFITSNTLQAQIRYTSIDIRIDSAVHHYNAFRTFSFSLQPQNLTESQVQETEKRGNAIKSEFEGIMRTASGVQYDVAAYFYNLTLFNIGFVYGMAGRLDDSYLTLNKISAYMQSQSSETFPKKYLFEGKSFSISYENFSSSQLEYFASMAELHAFKGNYADVFLFVDKVFNIPINNTGTDLNWYKYVSLVQFIKVSEKYAVYPDNAMEMGTRLLELYTKLTETEKQTIKNQNLVSTKTGYTYLITASQQNPAQNNSAYWLRAASALKQNGEMENAGKCYGYAIDAGIQDRTVFPTIYTYAITMINYPLGLKACQAELALIGEQDCAGRNQLAGNFRQFNDDATANQLEKEAADCFKEAELLAKAYEKEQKRKERRAQRNFSIYAGFYPIPLLTLQNDYRDYGGVAGIGFGKFSMEGSYKKINQNVVAMEDLTFNSIDYPEERILWDGYRAHVAFKFGERGGYDGDMFYGPMFEIVDKTYTPLPSQVFDVNGVSMGNAVFYPTELSYNAYLNFGLHVEQNHFMFEYFIGVGGSYSQFDIGNTTYDPELYDFSNTLLQNRKSERYGPIIRLGITLGLTTLD